MSRNTARSELCGVSLIDHFSNLPDFAMVPRPFQLRHVGRLTTIVACSLALSGCNIGILDSHGPIGAAEKSILIDSVAIMLAIVAPTIVAIFGFAWWFRASNSRARYLPHWAYSGRIELVVWAIPALVVMLLGGVTWIGSHELDPAKPIASSHPTLEIQVVSLDWKWLFIYPDQKIATVNTLTIPAGMPVHFSLTSSSVMNAFFIPQLGSMIYTMNGMTTRLNLKTDTAGIFHGLSSHFSGDGFSDMNFEVHAVSPADFAAWAQTASKAPATLDSRSYSELARQSTKVVPATYRLGDSNLFRSIATQMVSAGPGPQDRRSISPSGGTDVR
jgi:cytochrome o ubiquinol oxidase subunit 2